MSTTININIKPPRLSSKLYAIGETAVGWIMYPKNDVYVGKSIREIGEYGWDEWVLMRKFLDLYLDWAAEQTIFNDAYPPPVFIDGGANIGFFTICAAQHIKHNKGHVMAFEPQSFAFNALCASVALNDLTNVAPMRMAIGDVSGTVNIPQQNIAQLGNFAGFTMQGVGHKTGDPTPLRTIDSFELSGCTVLKLDIEGFEYQALCGAEKTVRKFKPVIYAENNQARKQGTLVRKLNDLGYTCYWHEPKMYRKDNFYGNPKPCWNGDPIAQNMICINHSIPWHVAGLPDDLPQAIAADGYSEDVMYRDRVTGATRIAPPTANTPAEGQRY